MTGIDLEGLGFEADVEGTRALNESIVSESSRCGCADCRNLVAARKTLHFEPLASFLRSLGADPEKDWDCLRDTHESEGSSWYRLNYEFCGRFKIDPGRDWLRANEHLYYAVWGSASADPSKTATLMLQVRLPWVLDEPQGSEEPPPVKLLIPKD